MEVDRPGIKVYDTVVDIKEWNGLCLDISLSIKKR